MSRAVENRIVDMTFNGIQFNAGVKDTIGNLEALKKSLDMSKAAENFNQIDAASKNVNFDAILDGLDYIRGRLSFVDQLFDQFFGSIIIGAANAGQRMISSLTVDQIYEGWDKYGQKVGSVQTIMNATGKSIDEVNGYLEELMWFSDETSYGFTDMTAALGQMASSGGEVEKLIPLITGVANATAFAGKGAAEFSRIMYNLNQSYAQGYLGLMDWKSIELAGAASSQLKQALIDAAVAQDKINEGSVTMANFSSTLAEKWADTEVIEAAFGRFAEASQEAYKMVNSGDVDTASEAYEILSGRMDGFAIKAAKSAQEAKTFGEAIAATQDAVSSGWMATYEILFGNYEEAKVLWTDLANTLWDAFASGAEARNAMLEDWVSYGGKTSALAGLANVWEAIWKVIDNVKEAFYDIFPPLTGRTLAQITEGFKNLSEKLILSDDASDKLIRTFRGLFSAVKIVGAVLAELGKVIWNVLGYLKPFAMALIDVIANFSDYLVEVKDAIENTSLFEATMKVLADIFNTSKEKIENAVESMKNAITGFITVVKEKLHIKAKDGPTGIEKLLAKLKDQFGWIADYKESIPKIFDAMASFFKSSLDKFKKIMNNTIDHFTLNSIANLTGSIFGTGVMAALFGFIKNLNEVPTQLKGIFSHADSLIGSVEKVFSSFSGKLHGIVDQIVGILDGVRKSLVVWQQSIQARTLFTIAKAIALLAASLAVLALIPAERIVSALTGMTFMFAELIFGLEHFVKTVSKFNFRKIGSLTSTIYAFAKSMVVLSIAILILSKLGWGELARGLTGVGVAMLELVGFLKLLSMITGKIPKVAGQLILLGFALNIFALAVKQLGKMDPDKLVIGLIGVGASLAAIAGFMTAISLVGAKSFKPLSILVLAGALMLMSKAVSMFGSIPADQLVNGLSAMAGVLIGLASFTAIIGYSKHVLSTAVSMVILAGALSVMANSVIRLGSLNWEEIAKGLVGLGGGMLSIAIGLATIPKKGMLDKALGLISIAEAVRMLSKPIITMSALSWEEIARGLVAMAGGLLIIAGAIRLMPSAVKMGEADFGLGGFAVALSLFAGAFNKLKTGSWEEMGIALVSLAGSLAIAAAGMALMRKGIPGAAAMLVMSAALAVFTPAILALAYTPWQGLVVALLAIAGVFAVVGGAAMLLSPAIVPMLGLAGAIAVLGVAIAAIGAGVLAFTTGLATLAAVGTAGALSLANTIRMLADMIPYIITKVAEGLVAFLNTIKDNVTVVSDAMAALIKAIADAIRKNTVTIMQAVGDLILAFMQTVYEYLPLIFNIGMELLNELLEGIAENIGHVASVVSSIIVNFINAVAYKLPSIIAAGLNLMLMFIRGLSEGVKLYTPLIVQEVINLGSNLIAGIIEGIGLGFTDLFTTIQNVGANMIEWLKDKLGIHSPSQEFSDIGDFSIEGLISGLSGHDEELSSTMGGIGSTLLDSLKKSTSGIPAIGQTSMAEFDDTYATGFDNVNERTDTGMGNVISTLSGYTPQFGEQGTIDMQTLISAMGDEEYNLVKTSGGLSQSSLGEFSSYKPKFDSTGTELGVSVANGMKTTVPDAQAAAGNVARAAYDIFEIWEADFFHVGAMATMGFVQGMRSKIREAARAAAEIAREAYDAAMDAVDAHSPSRKFFKLGQWVDEGFANGIMAYSSYVSGATSSMSEDTISSFTSTIRGISATLMDEFDETPTIRPVVDLTNVQAASREVDTLFSRNQTLNLSEPINVVRRVARSMEPRPSETIQNGSEEQPPVTQNFTFNQNNYSPKSLSRLDIYRQTRNQFSAFREKVRQP